jgi:hypothetical protein
MIWWQNYFLFFLSSKSRIPDVSCIHFNVYWILTPRYSQLIGFYLVECIQPLIAAQLTQHMNHGWCHWAGPSPGIGGPCAKYKMWPLNIKKYVIWIKHIFSCHPIFKNTSNINAKNIVLTSCSTKKHHQLICSMTSFWSAIVTKPLSLSCIIVERK